MIKIIITGGHLTPALALLEKLEKEKEHEIYFFGRKYAAEGSANFSAEYKLLTKTSINFVNITTGRLQRKFTRYTILSLAKIPVGFVQSFVYLAKIRPNIIVSFGGYLSLPVVFAGWLLGINSITHEQASIPGLATKINSLFVKRVFLTWPKSKKYFERSEGEGSKVLVIGNLTRQSIFKKNAKDSKINNFAKTGKVIFVTGGNLGSHFLNTQVFELIEKLKNYKIVHQVGATNYKGDLDHARRVKKSNYLALDYLDSYNIGAVLNRADLIISRSGANTVWDLAILAKVAILVPLQISAAGEQVENAKILKTAGSAEVIYQKDYTQDRLLIQINQIFNNLVIYQKKALAFSKTLPHDATGKIINYLNDKIKL